MRRLGFIAALLFSTVGCDQATKAIARETLHPHSYSFWGDIFRLQYIENTGAFLGMGSELSSPARFSVFTVGVSVLIFGLLVFLVAAKKLKPSVTLPLTLIASGGIGNLIDRATRGSVTDFMN